MSKNKSVPSGYGAKDSMGRLTIQGVYSELQARFDELRNRVDSSGQAPDLYIKEFAKGMQGIGETRSELLHMQQIARAGLGEELRMMQQQINALRDDMKLRDDELAKAIDEAVLKSVKKWNRCRFWLVVLGFFSLFCVTVIGVCAWFMWMGYSNVGSGGQVTILFP